jgi:hypothetical protein
MGWHDHEEEEKPKGEIVLHPDWQENGKYVLDFCEKKILPKGVNMYFGDAGSAVVGTIKKGIVYVSWMPPMEYPKGNYACPVFLHQQRYDFRNQFHAAYDWVNGLSQRFEKLI